MSHTGFSILQRFGLLVLTSLCTGCMLVTPHGGVPAQQAELPLLTPPKEGMIPLNISVLRQPRPATHIIGPGDVVNVYIHGVLPPGTATVPAVHSPQGVMAAQYYPPNGAIQGPSFGVPLEVSPNGTLRLPLLGEVRAAGLTVPQLENQLRQQYVSRGIIVLERERIFVNLARPRVHRVLVVREDTAPQTPFVLPNPGVPYAKRGQAQVVDLPAFENDVLHALTATGGLPGTDAHNEVWILRGGEGLAPTANPTAIKIPLRVHPGEPLPFQPSDVILNEGDVVFVPARDEYYYTAGLLPAGKVPMPRDDDLDVIEAIALSGGSVGGVGGVNRGGLFQSGGMGAVIPPSMVAVARKLPNGKQMLIRVDLALAMKDPKERITIQPGDVVYLHYTRGEMLGNMLLNLVRLNFLVDSGLKL